MNVNDRLGRLLLIVPYVAQRGGVPLAELAAKLGVSAAQIEHDLALLSMVGQPPLTPDHLIDVHVDNEVVYVDLDQSLTRPLRLTADEARALALGAEMVGRLGGFGDELTALLGRIAQQLGAAERAALAGPGGAAPPAAVAPAPPHAAVLRAAIEARQCVEVDYYSARSDRQKTYLLKPLALLAHAGVAYLIAHDTGAADREKLFRLDRVGRAAARPQRFEPPAELDLERFRTPRLVADGGPLVARVRCAPELAPRMRERFGPDEVEGQDDGSVVVTMATSSVAWLRRWVLSLGDRAEIVGPECCRQSIASLCAEAAAAYALPPPAHGGRSTSKSPGAG